jgi:ATP-dependent Clp protease ATP-binding subunit ClpC
MDEAGSRARIAALSRPPDIESLVKEIESVCQQKEKAIGEQHFEEAAKFRDQEKQLRAKQEEVTAEWKKRRDEKRVVIDEDLMMQVVADWTGIPLSRMEKKESEKLLSLENELQRAVIGQDIAAVAPSPGPCAGPAPISRIRAARSARSCSWARRASVRPCSRSSSPRRCSAIRTR